MGVYYPQAAMTLNVLWEDFNLKSDAALQKTYSMPILAKNVSVEINDYTTADTFECEIDYKHFPFDPRMIRACGVTIHMENTLSVFDGNNTLRAIKPTIANTIFQGFADEESISFDDDNRTVKLSGRDFTALLIDRQYSKGPLDVARPLNVVLQGLLDDLKETQPLKLDIRPAELEMPTLAAYYNDNHQLSGKKNIDRDENYWDVIQDLVARAGLISFIELDKLVLTKPRALYGQAANKSKVFVYGRNLSNLEIKRKIGRKKNFNVIVRSLAGKEVIEAKIPAEATQEWSDATGMSIGEVKIPEIGPKGEAVPPEKWKAAPYLSFRVPNCNSKDQLIKYAQEIYEEIGRQQLEGSFETKDMETWTIADAEAKKVSLSHAEAFNILKLRNGTPIQVRIDQGDLKGISNMASVASRQHYLELRGYESSIARIFAQSMGRFPDVFYTKSVRFTLDNDNGFSCQVEFLNFIDTKAKPPEA